MRLLHPDATDGGATATADAPTTETAAKPPPTPIAGGVGATKPPAPKAETATAPTAGATAFDWKSQIPADAPPAAKKYKTWEEYGKAHGALQAEHARLTAQVKAQPQIGADKWNALLANHYAGNQIDDADYDALQQAAGLDRGLVGRFFDFMKGERDAFIQKANAELSGCTYQQIEEWFGQEDCPFTPEVRAGFMQLTEMGDVSWIRAVGQQYTIIHGATNAGQQQVLQGNAVPPNRQAPAQKGPRALSYKETVRFPTRESWNAEMKKARDAGDHKTKQALIAELDRETKAGRINWTPLNQE